MIELIFGSHFSEPLVCEARNLNESVMAIGRMPVSDRILGVWGISDDWQLHPQICWHVGDFDDDDDDEPTITKDSGNQRT